MCSLGLGFGAIDTNNRKNAGGVNSTLGQYWLKWIAIPRLWGYLSRFVMIEYHGMPLEDHFAAPGPCSFD